MSTTELHLQSVLDLARSTLAVPIADHDAFIAAVDEYLSAFEQFVGEATELREQIGSERFSRYRPALEQLFTAHTEIQLRSEAAQNAVAGELGELRRRASALRSYIDTLPASISIVGKTKG